jgi:hypothetical protein
VTIEETLYSRLSGHAGLVALVTTGRIYPNIKAQDATLPAVSFRRVTSTRFPAMGSDPDLVKARFQVDAWAATYDSGVAVAAQIRDALQRWRNNSGITVLDTFIVSEVDLFEDDTRQHHIAIDVEINYYE